GNAAQHAGCLVRVDFC
ncbi:hypothetical protein A2U01_0106764, partial [Trifolium medium]|nr:hypothetical protein [Trifolium medium]